MSDLQEMLSFELDGKQRKAQRVRISDIGAVREAIRYERRQAALGVSPEAMGVLLAQPVKESELWDYIMSATGTALLLFNCVNRVDQTFTREMAEKMVMEGHEFVMRLFVESHLINPTKPKDSSKNSSPSK